MASKSENAQRLQQALASYQKPSTFKPGDFVKRVDCFPGPQTVSARARAKFFEPAVVFDTHPSFRQVMSDRDVVDMMSVDGPALFVFYIAHDGDVESGWIPAFQYELATREDLGDGHSNLNG